MNGSFCSLLTIKLRDTGQSLGFHDGPLSCFFYFQLIFFFTCDSAKFCSQLAHLGVVTHLMFTRRRREKRCHLWTTKLKPPDEAERKGAVFTMSTKAQKGPANNICTGWEQRSARLFWRAAAEEMECGFVTRGRKLCLRCDDAARPRLGQLDGGIKQRLRATSVAASSQLCRRFCFASLSIFMAKHPDMRRRVAEGLSACSSEKQCQGEKCIHDVSIYR